MLSTPPAFILSQDQTLMFKSFHPASQIWLPINRINLRFIPLNFIERIYCFKVVSLQKRSCVVIHNTLKFIESFKVISLFSYQGSLLFELFIHFKQLLHLSRQLCVCQDFFYFSDSHALQIKVFRVSAQL